MGLFLRLMALISGSGKVPVSLIASLYTEILPKAPVGANASCPEGCHITGFLIHPVCCIPSDTGLTGPSGIFIECGAV